jgi:hypothetical protein
MKGKRVMLKPEATLKPSLSSPDVGPDSSTPPPDGHDEPFTGGITCDNCGKVLSTKQPYRGRCLCFRCAINAHDRSENRKKGKYPTPPIPFAWDDPKG